MDEKELLWCEGGFTQNSEDLSGGTRMMLDARELPEGVGEVPVLEINPPVEEAIKPSGT